MTNGKFGKVIFDNLEENYIVESFTNNEKTINELLKEFGIHNRDIIIRVLVKHNIDYKNSSNKYGRKYFFNEYYFSKIDTKEKAYWLGFMYADGYISGTSTIGCGLKKEDENHLKLFLNAINISAINLEYSEKTNSCKFILTSKIMYDSLVKLGFSTNKSYDITSTVFEAVPAFLKRYFILGFWDGDGCFAIGANKRNIASVISNNEALLKTISLYINQCLEDDFSKVKYKTPGDPYTRIVFQNNKAKLFGDWLYTDAPACYLRRKYDKYLQMTIGTKVHFGFDNPRVKGILCIESNDVYVTATDCALSEFGVDNPGLCNGIRECCRGERSHYKNKHFRYLTEEERNVYINGKLNF